MNPVISNCNVTFAGTIQKIFVFAVVSGSWIPDHQVSALRMDLGSELVTSANDKDGLIINSFEETNLVDEENFPNPCLHTKTAGLKPKLSFKRGENNPSTIRFPLEDGVSYEPIEGMDADWICGHTKPYFRETLQRLCKDKPVCLDPYDRVPYSAEVLNRIFLGMLDTFSTDEIERLMGGGIQRCPLAKRFAVGRNFRVLKGLGMFEKTKHNQSWRVAHSFPAQEVPETFRKVSDVTLASASVRQSDALQLSKRAMAFAAAAAGTEPSYQLLQLFLNHGILEELDELHPAKVLAMMKYVAVANPASAQKLLALDSDSNMAEFLEILRTESIQFVKHVFAELSKL